LPRIDEALNETSDLRDVSSVQTLADGSRMAIPSGRLSLQSGSGGSLTGFSSPATTAQ
jgi:hypothetical protein